jgi:hypothetical protein
MTKTATVFADDEIAIARDGFICDIDGIEVIVKDQSRHRGSEPVVRQRPELFVKDGEPAVPLQRPEIPEPEPVIPEKVVIPKLRARKDWRSEKLEMPIGLGSAPQKITIVLHEGDIWDAGDSHLRLLSNKQLRELFEEVIDP